MHSSRSPSATRLRAFSSAEPAALAEQFQQGCAFQAVLADLPEPSVGGRCGEGGFCPGEMDGGHHRADDRMVLKAAYQQLGLLEPSLAEAQLSQGSEGLAVKGWQR